MKAYPNLEFKRRKLNKINNASFEHLVFKNGQLNTAAPPVRTSIYEHYYKRWINNFGRTQLLLIDGQELRNTPWLSVNKVETFLALGPVVTEQHFIFDESKGFYCIRENDNTPRCLSSSKGRDHISVSQATKEKLKELYKPYNERFYKLVNHNYHWN